MDWVNRVELGLLVLLVISQLDFFVGSFLPPSDLQMAQGFVGYNGSVFKSNLWSDYGLKDGDEAGGGERLGFFKVFSVFFPAVTGIVAGANFSGDLKDPGEAIPKGTLAAIATTYVSYFIYSIVIAGCTLRKASGFVDEVDVDFGANSTRPFWDCEGYMLNS